MYKIGATMIITTLIIIASSITVGYIASRVSSRSIKKFKERYI